MNHKLIAFTLCLIIVISSSGCSLNNNDNPDADKKNSEENSIVSIENKIEVYIEEEIQLTLPEDMINNDKSNWYDITMIIYDPSENKYSGYKIFDAYAPLSPCSTFKIPHALIALELGIVEQESSTIEWDGSMHQVQSWNEDHNLDTAIENSVVWYFQSIAEKIGETNMQTYIDKLDYGNKDISGGMDAFWLKSSLEISSIDQIHFLEKLYNNTLPFKVDHQEYVKSLIKLESNGGKTLYGKTGGGTNLGWFVGYIKNDNVADENVTYFALNFKNHDSASGENAKRIAIETLKDNNIY